MQQYCTHLQFNQWSKSYPYTFHDGENFDLAQVKLDYIPQQQIKKWNFLYSFPKTLWNTTYKHRNRGRLLRKRQNVCQKAYLSSWRNKSLNVSHCNLVLWPFFFSLFPTLSNIVQLGRKGRSGTLPSQSPNKKKNLRESGDGDMRNHSQEATNFTKLWTSKLANPSTWQTRNFISFRMEHIS